MKLAYMGAVWVGLGPLSTSDLSRFWRLCQAAAVVPGRTISQLFWHISEGIRLAYRLWHQSLNGV